MAGEQGLHFPGVQFDQAGTGDVGRGNAAARFHAPQYGLLEKITDRQALRDLPPGIAKVVVNFVTHSNAFGDLEILRGDLLDVVELRSGDQYKGTIQEKTLLLQTFYGTINLPAEKVLAMIAVTTVVLPTARTTASVYQRLSFPNLGLNPATKLPLLFSRATEQLLSAVQTNSSMVRLCLYFLRRRTTLITNSRKKYLYEQLKRH